MPTVDTRRPHLRGCTAVPLYVVVYCTELSASLSPEPQLSCRLLSLVTAVCVWAGFGMTMGNLAAFVHGAAVVYPGRVFNPRHTLECVVTQRCTALYGVPTMFISELSGECRYNHMYRSMRLRDVATCLTLVGWP